MYERGAIRDAVIDCLRDVGCEAPLDEIVVAVTARLGAVPQSSVRSYLNLNTPSLFERTGRGRYRLRGVAAIDYANIESSAQIDRAKLYRADAFNWLASQPPKSIHAVVTDPPYGIVEYSAKEKAKLREGKGGVWRIPPSFDGHKRAPLPRFTVLSRDDHKALASFFRRLGTLLLRTCVPGANVIVASNPLLSHIVASAMSETGLELRGYIARQVMTMRGGDRPKNAHEEFEGVSVMPRSQWEPWVVLRAPLEGRVQDNLRRYGVGGFRRLSTDKPFGDVIRSHPTPAKEKKIAPHPSLKPQAFMRSIVRASLPLESGIVCDPFAGAGATLAAANAVGYSSVGVEIDHDYYDLALASVPRLAALTVEQES
ncbi:MAG: site-specific DNA-methyltransferase [Methylocystis sp.]|nr:site-specific DNA-methyltransferase [Methylocystis sp.]